MQDAAWADLIDSEANRFASTDNDDWGDEEDRAEEEDLSAFGLLPEEVVIHIVGFLDGREILRLQCVSRRFRRVGADERVWERLCLRDFKMRYLTSQALWINYTRGYGAAGSSGPRPFFPFAHPGTKHTIKTITHATPTKGKRGWF